jgi:hypothetical protein
MSTDHESLPKGLKGHKRENGSGNTLGRVCSARGKLCEHILARGFHIRFAGNPWTLLAGSTSCGPRRGRPKSIFRSCRCGDFHVPHRPVSGKIRPPSPGFSGRCYLRRQHHSGGSCHEHRVDLCLGLYDGCFLIACLHAHADRSSEMVPGKKRAGIRSGQYVFWIFCSDYVPPFQLVSGAAGGSGNDVALRPLCPDLRFPLCRVHPKPSGTKHCGLGTLHNENHRCVTRGKHSDLHLLAHLVHMGLCRGRRHFHGHSLNILRSGARSFLRRSDPNPYRFQCDQRPKQAPQRIPLRSGGAKPHHDDRISRRRLSLPSHEFRASSLGLGDPVIHGGLCLRHPFRRLGPPHQRLLRLEAFRDNLRPDLHSIRFLFWSLRAMAERPYSGPHRGQLQIRLFLPGLGISPGGSAYLVCETSSGLAQARAKFPTTPNAGAARFRSFFRAANPS